MERIFQILDDPRWQRGLALAIVAVGVLLRLLYPSSIYFNIHAERDVWRTLLLLNGERFPTMGSELTMGGYTPGPALYWLQIPPLLLTLDPRGLLVWLAVLHGGAIWLTYLIGREHFSPRVGLTAAALFATYPLAVLALRYLWNPSYLFPLTALFFWCLMDWVFARRVRRVPWMFAAVAAMIQIHIAALMLLALALICAAIYRPPMTKKIAAISAGVFFLIFSPYIIGDGLNGFENSRKFTDPPENLTTANGAVIPILEKERVLVNIGAMKALQVALSPVFYDRRYETGSFSYLALLAEYGHYHIHPALLRTAFTLHHLRWCYVLVFGLFGALTLAALLTPRLRLYDNRNEGEAPRWGYPVFFLVTAVVTILPPMVSRTMVAPLDDDIVGIGAVRYYFVNYPMQFLALALFARWVVQALRPLAGAILAALTVMAPLAAVLFLQALTTTLALYNCHAMKRTFKYSFYETFDWTVQREAADHLINEWGVTPDQFDHRVYTLDHTFDSTRWDVPSLEMGLDYAYYTHPDLDTEAEPMHPGATIYVYDQMRQDFNRRKGLPTVNLEGMEIIDRANIYGLQLVLSPQGERLEHSMIQNTWEKFFRLESLKD